MKRAVLSEAEMAATVVAELQRFGYETYEEVFTGNRADIVGVRGPVLAVVECKVSLSLQFLNQLLAWEGKANVIIGAYALGRFGVAVHRVCRSAGIGLWQIDGPDIIATRVPPRLFRKIDARLRQALAPQNKSGASVPAGTNGGGYYTPFRDTCDALRKIVASRPEGMLLREALSQFSHHYASDKNAMAALPKLIRSGVIQGIRVDNGTPLKIFPAGVQAPVPLEHRS